MKKSTAWYRPNKTPRASLEHDEQVAVFDLLRANEAKFPLLRLIFAIPNGGHRNIVVAGKLKAEGVKKGIPDIYIPIPHVVCAYHGAFIEMKAGKNKPTKEQQDFLIAVEKLGYATAVCYDSQDAIIFIESYLGIKLTK